MSFFLDLLSDLWVSAPPMTVLQHSINVIRDCMSASYFSAFGYILWFSQCFALWTFYILPVADGPWLGPLLMTLEFFMYFQFCGWHHGPHGLWCWRYRCWHRAKASSQHFQCIHQSVPCCLILIYSASKLLTNQRWSDVYDCLVSVLLIVRCQFILCKRILWNELLSVIYSLTLQIIFNLFNINF